MQKKYLAPLASLTLAASLLLVSGQAAAEDSAAAASEHTVTGNIGLFSSYRFRGIDQSFARPAVQGGIDYSHASGFYVGNWNSNVSSGAGYPDGNLEMDFYAGYKQSIGEVGLDVGGLYYYYPGSEARPLSNSNRKNGGAGSSGTVHNGELYVAATWKILTVKYSHAVTDYFSLPDSKGAGYLDLSANYELGDGWAVNGHIGHLNVRKYAYAATSGSTSANYSDWKLGVTKDVSGWTVGAAYVGTNAKGDCGKAEFYCFASSLNGNGQTGSNSKDAGRGIAVLSVAKSF